MGFFYLFWQQPLGLRGISNNVKLKESRANCSCLCIFRTVRSRCPSTSSWGATSIGSTSSNSTSYILHFAAQYVWSPKVSPESIFLFIFFSFFYFWRKRYEMSFVLHLCQKSLWTHIKSTFVRFRREKDPDWDADIRDDVLEECTKYGQVYHIHVDKSSNQVCVWRSENCCYCVVFGLRSWGLFLKSPETFRAYFRSHNSLYIVAALRF